MFTIFGPHINCWWRVHIYFCCHLWRLQTLQSLLFCIWNVYSSSAFDAVFKRNSFGKSFSEKCVVLSSCKYYQMVPKTEKFQILTCLFYIQFWCSFFSLNWLSWDLWVVCPHISSIAFHRWSQQQEDSKSQISKCELSYFTFNFNAVFCVKWSSLRVIDGP